MPYIVKENREQVGKSRQAYDVGELNYLITKACDTYLQGTLRRYTDYNSVIGVLECAKLELYARVVRPYEQKKMEEHGDVYSE